MAVKESTRVDTTFIGYLLIGFIFLIMGVMGLQDGSLFGGADAAYTDKPIDLRVFAQIMGIVGLVLILLSVFAYRTGKGPAAAIFTFFGIAFIIYDASAMHFYDSLVSNSNWFMYMTMAIFFLIFMVYSLAAKAPKFVALLLLLAALTFLFFSLGCCFYVEGPASNADIYKGMAITYGIFAFLTFIVATYLGLAYANPKRIPVI